MYAPRNAASRMSSQFSAIQAEDTHPRYPKTSEIRAFLSDLKMRPASHREFLCKLLRSAAANSASKVSAVTPSETPHSTQP